MTDKLENTLYCSCGNEAWITIRDWGEDIPICYACYYFTEEPGGDEDSNE